MVDPEKAKRRTTQTPGKGTLAPLLALKTTAAELLKVFCYLTILLTRTYLIHDVRFAIKKRFFKVDAGLLSSEKPNHDNGRRNVGATIGDKHGNVTGKMTLA